MNRAWLARVQSGVTLASELAGKLATARTIPNAAAACQECMNRQMEMFVENSRQMFADSEKLMRLARACSPMAPRPSAASVAEPRLSG
jgi:hypothetical protein